MKKKVFGREQGIKFVQTVQARMQKGEKQKDILKEMGIPTHKYTYYKRIVDQENSEVVVHPAQPRTYKKQGKKITSTANCFILVVPINQIQSAMEQLNQ